MKDEIKDLIQKASKSYKCNIKSADDPLFELKLISTGISVLDRLLGGGLPRARMHILTGPFGTGKTTLAYNIVASAQSKGGICVWLDAERRFNPEWAKKNGIELEDLVMNQPNYGEQAIDLIIFYLQQKVDIIAVDSLAALIPLAQAEASSEKDFIGLQARMFSDAFKKIVPENDNTVFLAINQQRKTIGSRFNPGILKTMPGGEAQFYHASSIVEITRKGWITEKGSEKEEEKVSAKRRSIGFNINCFLEKCDYAVPYRDCDIPFSFITGKMDDTSAIVDIAIDLKLIKQGGAWYHFEDQKFMGKQALLDWFNEDLSRVEGLKEKI